MVTLSKNRNIGITSIPVNTDDNAYIAGEELIQAVEIAIALNKPLVVSGEPGTGKTRLAYWVASQLYQQTQGTNVPFAPRALVFNTKSGSSANDLFYYYDAVSHFRSNGQEIHNFIELRAMGLAIALAHGRKSPAVSRLTPLRQYQQLTVDSNASGQLTISDHPQSSVVLIDEIDKAPRDFPNDLLNEMENYEFSIREMGVDIPRPQTGAKTIVIMTSNSEKNLPNAFLRRCVYYHIPFPDRQKLLEITKARMVTNSDSSYDSSILQAIDLFNEFREKSVNKKPATSEFLDWINVLRQYDLLGKNRPGEYSNAGDMQKYLSSLNTLFKSKEDLERVSPGLASKNT